MTHHPTAEIPCDWTPDGDLLFYAGGIEGMPRAAQLFTVPAEGGLPRKMPVPYGAAGAMSPDGAWLAYTPYTRDSRTWKRYRGGMASDIWIFNLDTNEGRAITDWEGTDTLPMWHGTDVYYLSDAGPRHRLNIWSLRHDQRRAHEQVTSTTTTTSSGRRSAPAPTVRARSSSSTARICACSTSGRARRQPSR